MQSCSPDVLSSVTLLQYKPCALYTAVSLSINFLFHKSYIHQSNEPRLFDANVVDALEPAASWLFQLQAVQEISPSSRFLIEDVCDGVHYYTAATDLQP